MVRQDPIEDRREGSAVPFTVHGTSAGLGWKGIFSSLESAPPVSGGATAGADEGIIVHRSSVGFRWREGRQRRSETVVPGTVHLLPSESDFEIESDGGLQTQTIMLGRDVLIEVASELVASDPANVRLQQAVYRAPTPQLLLFDSIAAAIVGRDATSAMYVEYAARAIAAQLLVSWRADRGQPAPVGLPPGRGGDSRTVRRAVEFMHANMGTKLTLKLIAESAGVSVTTLCRAFRIELGVAPHQALVKLRLQRAQELLKKSRATLPDIAAQCGFWSQEHMTVSFRTHFGLTPGAYRRITSG